MAQREQDTALARLLMGDGRVDSETLRVLLAQTSEGLNLATLLTHRGLLNPAELQSYLARLTPQSGSGPVGLPQRRSAMPEQLGQYRILEQLGAGGMGAVWLAEHSVSGVRYAVKTLRSGALGNRRERFKREGQAQARSDSHPNVVKVHQSGEESDFMYLVMELCQAGDLAKKLEGGPLDPVEATRLVAALADGLQHVHEQDLLHRDLKPANILFDDAGTPKLVDFGLAKPVDAETLTKTGTMVGTIAYMPPEQARGKNRELDARTDVYSLGVVLYECLTGQLPFSGVGIAMIREILKEKPPAPRSIKKEIPKALEQVCLRAMEKEPDDRYPSAAAFAKALRGTLPNAVETSASGGGGLKLSVALNVVLGVVAGLALLLPRGEDPAASAQEPPEAAWVALAAQAPAMAKQGRRDEAARLCVRAAREASGEDTLDLIERAFAVDAYSAAVNGKPLAPALLASARDLLLNVPDDPGLAVARVTRGRQHLVWFRMIEPTTPIPAELLDALRKLDATGSYAMREAARPGVWWELGSFVDEYDALLDEPLTPAEVAKLKSGYPTSTLPERWKKFLLWLPKFVERNYVAVTEELLLYRPELKWAWLHLGWKLEKMGEQRRARRALEVCANLDSSQHPRYFLGKVLIQLERPAESIPILQKAVDIGLANEFIDQYHHFFLAVAKHRTGKHAEALVLLDRCEKKIQGNPKYWRLRGDVQDALDDPQGATESLAQERARRKW